MEINCTVIECLSDKDKTKTLFNFLILDAPTPSNLPTYIKELQRRNVRHLVRVCGPTYDAGLVQNSGINVHSWPFDDGAPPTRAVIENWFALLDLEKSNLEKGTITEPATVAVHCVAGLGRAPILVALALVEYGHVPALDAITLIRERRRGAINQIQMHWLVKYKRRGQGSDCSVM
ncbi:protein-tyrosine phosphatase [Angomonas deanei]|uniref:Protein tyrosine phosphatase PRL-1 n=1 Tax=Angomonas deanei TaxID=59799 RepID=S9WU29_9TRYP|nr:protein-tyrosine phosphatase [Angomonas deanei]EPY40931.1 protein-tyrosine phosphatase [Angomonas deanei]EPY42900.1 protein-tyrosine phosphatase [Angomonas deanei]EPY42956.1 protein-tyrosine phosphatase [Angomonas deanei]CAD2212664.1 Dual specificity phosphatase, catalytic domain containing protein, putative [Angomonas deanei]|eukprot:EPY31227.1 protein-tyrosine phosphatase [Angomonas deanei]